MSFKLKRSPNSGILNWTGPAGVTVTDRTRELKNKHNNFSDYKTANKKPESIIIHYTAGSSAQGSANWLARDDVKASAHLIIGRDGNVIQLVPLNKIAWHAGESHFGGRSNFNNFSIGIELDNAGEMTPSGNVFRASFGTAYDPSDVLEARHKNRHKQSFWHAYTDVQLERLIEILQLLTKQYGISEILGHDDIAPDRKTDPGPAFPMNYVQKHVFGDDRQSAVSSFKKFDGAVTASKLNIRAGADVSFDRVSKALIKGQDVKVLRENNGWYEVETKVTGWVSKAFIKKK